MTLPHYAEAGRSEEGQCWRLVTETGARAGQPTGCPEEVRWVGVVQFGRDRLMVWACDGHRAGLEDARPYP